MAILAAVICDHRGPEVPLKITGIVRVAGVGKAGGAAVFRVLVVQIVIYRGRHCVAGAEQQNCRQDNETAQDVFGAKKNSFRLSVSAVTVYVWLPFFVRWAAT